MTCVGLKSSNKHNPTSLKRAGVKAFKSDVITNGERLVPFSAIKPSYGFSPQPKKKTELSAKRCPDLRLREAKLARQNAGFDTCLDRRPDEIDLRLR